MTYTHIAISILSAFATGAVLGGRYLALVLLPASIIVVAAISEAGFILGAGVFPSIMWAIAGLFALQLGYVLGSAALRFLFSVDASPPLDPAERGREPSPSDLRLR